MANAGDAKPSPWSIKGVSGEARAVTKQAAAANSLTMGQWLSHVIQAHETPQPMPERAATQQTARQNEAPNQASAQ